jgi:hypothetical protein
MHHQYLPSRPKLQASKTSKAALAREGNPTSEHSRTPIVSGALLSNWETRSSDATAAGAVKLHETLYPVNQEAVRPDNFPIRHSDAGGSEALPEQSRRSSDSSGSSWDKTMTTRLVKLAYQSQRSIGPIKCNSQTSAHSTISLEHDIENSRAKQIMKKLADDLLIVENIGEWVTESNDGEEVMTRAHNGIAAQEALKNAQVSPDRIDVRSGKSVRTVDASESPIKQRHEVQASRDHHSWLQYINADLPGYQYGNIPRHDDDEQMKCDTKSKDFTSLQDKWTINSMTKTQTQSLRRFLHASKHEFRRPGGTAKSVERASNSKDHTTPEAA